jgi:alkylation response protein AidB-like acyl-CoA dehydrogenase
MVGPVIYTFGSEEQKAHYLPRIANLDDWWCQGFSEPGSGSDLASLKTKAVRDGDHYVVNGQKTWTTLAQYADWIFCLVRTDPAAKKQEGISFLLIDMKSPGVTVRPIELIDGGREVNEVFFDDVRVPARTSSGARTWLGTTPSSCSGNERTNIRGSACLRSGCAASSELASIERIGEEPMIRNPRFRREACRRRGRAQIAGDDAASRRGGRAHAGEGHSRTRPPPCSRSRAPEIQQATTELLMDVVRPLRAPYVPERDDERWDELSNEPRSARMGRDRRADLLQLAQGLDLRRLERDPEADHREGDFGAVALSFRARACENPGTHDRARPVGWESLNVGSRVGFAARN